MRVLAGWTDEDPDLKCARERVLDENPGLRARDLAQQLRWQQQVQRFLEEEGVAGDGASLASGLVMTVWRESYRRWIAAAAAPGALAGFLDAVLAELPRHALEASGRSR